MEVGDSSDSGDIGGGRPQRPPNDFVGARPNTTPRGTTELGVALETIPEDDEFWKDMSEQDLDTVLKTLEHAGKEMSVKFRTFSGWSEGRDTGPRDRYTSRGGHTIIKVGLWALKIDGGFPTCDLSNLVSWFSLFLGPLQRSGARSLSSSLFSFLSRTTRGTENEVTS